MHILDVGAMFRHNHNVLLCTTEILFENIECISIYVDTLFWRTKCTERSRLLRGTVWKLSVLQYISEIKAKNNED